MLTLLFAVCVIVARDLVRAVTALLFALLMTAGMYFALGADFLGAVQIVLYVGGVVVLVLFGVMLTRDVEMTVPYLGFGQFLPALIVAGAVTWGLWHLADFLPRKAFPPVHRSVTPILGELFMKKYIVAFEVASVLLVGVLIGAAYLVRREVRREE